MSSPRKRSKPCRFHNNGGCKKRSDECAYDHVIISPNNDYPARTTLPGYYGHRLSPRNERNYDTSKADDKLNERCTGHRRHPSKYRSHRRQSKSHTTPDHRDQDLRKNSEYSNPNLSKDDACPDIAKSNAKRKSYYNSPAILRNYFSSEDIAKDIISDQMQSEKLSPHIIVDQLNSDQTTQNKICKLCFIQYNCYLKDDGENCISCQTPMKIDKQQTLMPSNDTASFVNMAQPTNYVTDGNNSKLLIKQNSLELISEESLSEDNAGMPIKIKSEISTEQECDMKSAKESTIHMACHLPSIKTELVDPSDVQCPDSFRVPFSSKFIQRESSQTSNVLQNCIILTSNEAKFLPGSNVKSIKSENTESYNVKSLFDSSECMSTNSDSQCSSIYKDITNDNNQTSFQDEQSDVNMGPKHHAIEAKKETIDDGNKKYEIEIKTIKVWKEIIKRQQNDISELKAQKITSDEEMSKMKAINDRLQNTVEKNNENFITYENQINALNYEISEGHERYKILEQKNKEDIESFKKNLEERRRLKNESFLKQLKEGLENLKAQEIKRMEQKYKEESTKIQETLEGENIEMQKSIKNNVNKIALLSNQNTEKAEKILKITKKWKQKDLKIKDRDACIVKIKNEIKEKDLAIKELEANITKLQNQNRKKDFNLEEKGGIIKILRDQLQRLQNRKITSGLS